MDDRMNKAAQRHTSTRIYIHIDTRRAASPWSGRGLVEDALASGREIEGERRGAVVRLEGAERAGHSGTCQGVGRAGAGGELRAGDWRHCGRVGGGR